MMLRDALKSTNKSARANLKPDPDSGDDLMISTSMELSRKLRASKEEGGEECDLVIALTHAEFVLLPTLRLCSCIVTYIFHT